MMADGTTASTMTAAGGEAGLPPDPFAADIERAAKSAFAASTKAMDEYQRRLKAEGPVLDARGATMQQLIDTMPGRADLALPKGPKDTAATQPKAPEPDPIQSFGSFASILGIIGSAVLKQPLSTALNASAAAMQARTANDWHTYEAKYKEWKDQTDLAYKQADWEQKHFSDALELMRTDQAAGMAKFSALATLTNNDAARIALESGDPKMMGEYAGSLARLSEAMNTQAIRVQELKVRQDYYDWLKSGGKMGSSLGAMRAHVAQLRAQAKALPAGDPQRAEIEASADRLEAEVDKEQAASKAPPATTLSPDALDLAATSYLVTGQMPAMGLGSSGDRQAILNRAGELAKTQGATADDIVAGRASFKANTSSLTKLQATADAAQAFEGTMLDNMKVVRQLMDKGAGTAAGPVVNRWLQAGKVATGDPDVKAFNAAIVTVMDEYAKILSGSTSGAQRITDAARNQTEAMLSQWDSPAAINKTFDAVMVPDSGNRIRNYDRQLSEIKARMGANGGKGGSAGGSEPTYSSAADVFKAIDAKQISADEGKKILIDKFGYAPAETK